MGMAVISELVAKAFKLADDLRLSSLAGPDRGSGTARLRLSNLWCQYEDDRDGWQALSRKLKESVELSPSSWLRSKLQEAADRLASVNEIPMGDISNCIENYASIVKSNIREVYERMSDVSSDVTKNAKVAALSTDGLYIYGINYTIPRLRSLNLIDTLRCIFETIYQRIQEFQKIHKHSTYMLYESLLLYIFNELQEADTLTVKLLQEVKDVANFINQLPSSYVPYLDNFIYNILKPIIKSVDDWIFKFDKSMERILKYAESISIVFIIIVFLPFICQSSPESATDMEQLMIFATVIHLIICGDVESNPGPQYYARDLLKKEPKVCDLQRIFSQSDVVSYWETIGRALEVKVNDLITEPNSEENKLGSVFERWIQKYEDVTWERIIQVCKDYKYGKVRYAILKFLSSPEAHEKYGSEPDFDCTYTESMTLHRESKENENGYSNKTVIILLIILIILVIILIVLVSCNFIYQVWADLALQGQCWPHETTCRTDCEC